MPSTQSNVKLNLVAQTVEVNVSEQNNKLVTSLTSFEALKDAVKSVIGNNDFNRTMSKAEFWPKPQARELVEEWVKRAKFEETEPCVNISVEEPLNDRLRPILGKASLGSGSLTSTVSLKDKLEAENQVLAEKQVLATKLYDLEIRQQIIENRIDRLEDENREIKESHRRLQDQLDQSEKREEELNEKHLLADFSTAVYKYFIHENRANPLIKPYVDEIKTESGMYRVINIEMRLFYQALNASNEIKELMKSFYQVDSLDFLENVRGLVRSQRVHPLEEIERYGFNMNLFLEDVELSVVNMTHYRSEADDIVNKIKPCLSKQK